MIHTVAAPVTLNRNALLIAEVVLCFALPVIYLVPFGILSLIVMLPWAFQGAGFAIFNVITTIAGCFGLVALIGATTFVLSGRWRGFAESCLLKLSAAGSVLALWAISTNMFREFDINPVLILMAVLPTFSTVHILWLVRKRLNSAVE